MTTVSLAMDPPVTPESVEAARLQQSNERRECERLGGVRIGEDGIMLRSRPVRGLQRREGERY